MEPSRLSVPYGHLCVDVSNSIDATDKISVGTIEHN